MKYKIILFLFILSACSPQLKTLNMKEPYAANGFAYIYNEPDFNEKIIKGKMNNEILQISHQNLKTGTLIKITNPKNKESLVLKNIKIKRKINFLKRYIKDFDDLNIKDNLSAAIIIPDKDIIPGAETLSPAYIIFDNYEKILNWNRSLRFSLAVCTLKERFENEI